MNTFIKSFVIFLVLNFIALGIGGFATGPGVSSEWYANLNKAPWTPPGWVFGAAWTTIMICFAIYLAYLWKVKVIAHKTVLTLFGLQWILNVFWNPLFFNLQWTVIALFSISALTLLMFYFLFKFKSVLKAKSLFVLPYVIWLCIATSLNAYIVFKN